MNILGFFAFFMGLISIIISIRYAQLCEPIHKTLPKILIKLKNLDMSYELQHVMYIIQEKTNLNDSEFAQELHKHRNNVAKMLTSSLDK